MAQLATLGLLGQMHLGQRQHHGHELEPNQPACFERDQEGPVVAQPGVDGIVVDEVAGFVENRLAAVDLDAVKQVGAVPEVQVFKRKESEMNATTVAVGLAFRPRVAQR